MRGGEPLPNLELFYLEELTTAAEHRSTENQESTQKISQSGRGLAPACFERESCRSASNVVTCVTESGKKPAS